MGDDEAKEILASLDAPGDAAPDDPGSSPDSGDPRGEAPGAAQAAWNAKDWEFDYAGKRVAPESREKALTWLSQGYNNSQRMFELNKARSEFEKQRTEHETKYKGYDRYAEIDAYAVKNKDWWDHVNKSWETRGQQQAAQGQQPNGEFNAVLAPLQKQLAELSAWQQDQLAAKAQQEQVAAQQDQERYEKALSDEIDSIRTAHANIDFDSVDDSGKTLELRVIDHCQQIGTTSFRAGFRDYYHEKLVESGKAASLSAQAKGASDRAKRGILSESSAPRRANGTFDHKGRNYDQINDQIKNEFLSANN